MKQGATGTLALGMSDDRSGDDAAAKQNAPPPQPGTYYRYQDQSGHVTIVDSLDRLPVDVRQKAVRIELSGGPEAVHEGGGELSATERFGGSGFWERLDGMKLDGASFGLGLGAGLLIATLLFLVFGRGAGGWGRWVLRGALGVAVALLILGGYLGWLRRSAGLGDSALASPTELVEDARKAVEQVRQQRAAQEKQLQDIKDMSK